MNAIRIIWRDLRWQLFTNCSKGFTLRFGVDLVEQVIGHYYSPNRIRLFLTRNGFLFSGIDSFSLRLLNARNTFITSIAYGFPFHAGVFLFKEFLFLCKWLYEIIKYRWNIYKLSNKNEQSFYKSNSNQVIQHHTSQLLHDSVKNLIVCSSSLVLVAIGVGISSYISPSLNTDYIHSNLSSLRQILLQFWRIFVCNKYKTLSFYNPKWPTRSNRWQ